MYFVIFQPEDMLNLRFNHHGAEILLISLAERSTIKLLILHATREK